MCSLGTIYGAPGESLRFTTEIPRIPRNPSPPPPPPGGVHHGRGTDRGNSRTIRYIRDRRPDARARRDDINRSEGRRNLLTALLTRQCKKKRGDMCVYVFCKYFSRFALSSVEIRISMFLLRSGIFRSTPRLSKWSVAKAYFVSTMVRLKRKKKMRALTEYNIIAICVMLKLGEALDNDRNVLKVFLLYLCLLALPPFNAD